MALTRKFLTALGIEPDKIDEIITAHSETVDALKKERDEFKADAGKVDSLQTEKTAVQKELDDLKAEIAKNSDKDYDALKKEYDDYKAEQEKKESRAAKEKAFRGLLKDANIDEKHFEKVIKYSDIDAIELTDKGEIQDAKDRVKSIKEEWPELIATKQTQGANTPNPPGNNGGMVSRPSRAAQLAAQYAAERYGTKANNGNNAINTGNQEG